MLVDYYRRTVGTPMKQPYTELVLQTLDEDHLLLEYYTNGDTPEERVSGYRVPKEAYQKILKIIDKYRLPKWNDRRGRGLCGVIEAVRFYRNGDYTRVSTEHMPENGRSAFSEIAAVMRSYLDENALLYRNYTHTPPEEEEVPVVKDREELMSYGKLIPLTTDNWSDHFTLTSGMGSRDETGELLDHVDYYVLVYLKKGAFPCRDLFLSFGFTEVHDGKESPGQTSITGDTVWHFDPLDDACRCHPLVYQDLTTFRDMKVLGVSGHLIAFEIPEELLRTDDTGTYFCYKDRSTRYYLDGFTGRVIYIDHPKQPTEEGVYVDRKNLWFPEILNEES
ncbi:MAG: hypothetical protein IIZ47_04815 [Erysipelotrichaceae bacterium]|nr:hypothetical protein [Erysipelotrichaceae bacterium]